jgi:hypothetical protein
MAREADDVEWLDTEPPPNPAAGPRLPRRTWFLLLGAVVVAVVLVLTLTNHRAKRAAPPATPTPTPSSSTSSFQPESSAPTTPPVSVTNLGHPLLNVPTSWELIARSTGDLFRIQLATGRITRTSAAVASSALVSLVVGPHEVIVRPWDFVAGYLIRDGQPARDLLGMLAVGGPAIPGPTPTRLWVQTDDEQHPRMALVDLDGRPTGVSVPGQDYGVVSDGAGYLIVRRVGGAYDARPDGLHRITSGDVLATGPTGWLAEECDDRHHCTLDVIDRRSGAHRVLGSVSDNEYSGGVISPDGDLAALEPQATASNSNVVLHLIDLSSGTDHTTRITLSNLDPGSAMVWSPDSRWLFVADAAGRIIAVDHTGHPQTLDTRLPAILQLTMRQR